MRSEFSLKAHAKLDSMVKGINQIIPLAQGTMTGLAIRYVMNVAFTSQEGDRPKVPAPETDQTLGPWFRGRAPGSGTVCQGAAASARGTACRTLNYFPGELRRVVKCGLTQMFFGPFRSPMWP